MKACLLGIVDRLRTDGKPASLRKSNFTNSKQTAVSDSHKSFERQKIELLKGGNYSWKYGSLKKINQ